MLRIILALMLVASAASGQPSISAVVGTAAPADTLTISGNGFGYKGVPRPMRYDSFDSFADEIAATGNTWAVYYGTSVTPHQGDLDVYTASVHGRNVYTSTGRPRYDGDISLWSLLGYGSYDNYAAGVPPFRYGNKMHGIINFGTEDLPEIYVSYWMYRDPIYGEDVAARAGNAKWWTNYTSWPPATGLTSDFRVDVYPSAGDWPANGAGHSFFNDCGPYQTNETTGLPDDTLFRHGLSAENFRFNEFVRFEKYLKFGDDGEAWTNLGEAPLAAPYYGAINIVGGCNPFNTAITDFYYNYNDGVPDGAVDQYRSEAYYDTTQARIEIGDAATWSSCQHKELQIPIEWSDTQIKFIANDGLLGITDHGSAFVHGETAWLYVVHRSGAVNSTGKAITIGGTIAPGAPGQPQNVTATEN